MPDNFIIGGEPFPLVNGVVLIAGRPIPIVQVPYNERELERIVKIRGLKESGWPYWLEEWPVNYTLAEFLDGQNPKDWPGPILDLGCGSGFLTRFLQARFGLKAFGFDFNADACRMAGLNNTGGSIFCGDFSAFPSKAAFGLIVAGDMLYARDIHQPLLDFLVRHLAQNGTAFLADPGRSSASSFAATAEASGFLVDILEAGKTERYSQVRVYRLSHQKFAPAMAQ